MNRAKRKEPMNESIEEVEYRKLPYNHFYCVGSDGSVWRWKRRAVDPGDTLPPAAWWRKLKPVSCGRRPGFERYQVKVFDGKGGYRNRHVPHLVLETFVGPRPPGMECCHGEGGSGDNRLKNLRWDTKAANSEDVVVMGSQRGEKNNNRKLIAEQVIAIRRDWKSGIRPKRLAAKYGVSQSAIVDIISYRNWKHVA